MDELQLHDLHIADAAVPPTRNQIGAHCGTEGKMVSEGNGLTHEDCTSCT